MPEATGVSNISIADEPAFNVTGHSHRGGFEEEKENYQFLVFFHGFVESMSVILVSESEPN